MKEGFEMRIKIDNFAKIKEADIEINGITIIAGENNTGKSTVGKVLYSAFDSFYNISRKVPTERKNRVLSYLGEIGYFEDEISDFIYLRGENNLDEIYNKLFEIDVNQYSKETVIETYLSILSDYISEETFQMAGVNDTVENIYTVMCIGDEDIRKTIVNRIFNVEFNGQLLPLYDNVGESKISLQIKNNFIDLEINESIEIKKYIPLMYQVVYIDSPFILDSIEEHSLIRRRIYKGHSLSTSDRLSQRTTMSIIDETISNVTLEKIKSRINDVIKGEFIVKDRKLMFSESGIKDAINVSNLSTGMKSFAMILRLLDNGYIIKNSFIILDEPEVNLHPKWQLKLAELLVMMQKELGLHILLNSHSPYFINAIEVYSAQYKIANLCKYYLADLVENKAEFEDVTKNIEKIYKLLAKPLRFLSDMSYEKD